jgi:hypothetical protein
MTTVFFDEETPGERLRAALIPWAAQAGIPLETFTKLWCAREAEDPQLLDELLSSIATDRVRALLNKERQ